MLVAQDEVAFVSILSGIEAAVPQIQKSTSSLASKNLISAVNIVHCLASSSTCCAVIATKPTAKGGKDVFPVILQLIETLKSSPTNTPQYELLLVAMKTLQSFAHTHTIRRKLLARKKWVQKLLTVLNAIKQSGRRRGAVESELKVEIVDRLREIFGEKV